MSAAPIPRPARRLQAARLIGATVIGVLAERVVSAADSSYLATALLPGLTAGALYSLTMALVARIR